MPKRQLTINCPLCGVVSLNLDLLHVRQWGDTGYSYQFDCVQCKNRIFEPCSAEDAWALRSVGGAFDYSPRQAPRDRTVQSLDSVPVFVRPLPIMANHYEEHIKSAGSELADAYRYSPDEIDYLD